MNAPQGTFHFAAEAASGGPGTADPGMFRCSQCTMATLILKAFRLQPYQLPARASLKENSYDVTAKLPAGATADDFAAMLQNLLKERFGLAGHFQAKTMKGYRLVVGKDGAKLKESTGAAAAASDDQHSWGQGGNHEHGGAMTFGAFASYRAVSKTTADLARVISDQIGLPVEDATGLTGKYDIALRWAGTGETHAAHAGGDFSGGQEHAGHDGGSAAGGSDPSAPALFDALQQQLGLKLTPAEAAPGQVFVVDKVAQRPVAN